MAKFQFVKIDSILSKFKRDFRGVDIHEGDAIEWIGEALGFMKIVSASEEAIAFIEVKNYHVQIPNGLHFITQIARNNNWSSAVDNTDCYEDLCEDCDTPIPTEDQYGELSDNYSPTYYRPFLDLQYEYSLWSNSHARHSKYTPVRLANHSFFDTLVCREPGMDEIYHSCRDEYTVVQDQIRFSFESGFVAIAYTRQMLDCHTGYPMIPDDESARAAITYYLGWKAKETEAWNHREGAMNLAQVAKAEWLHYIKQFKNKAKMPTGVDQHQNLMDQVSYLIPQRNRYYGFFGKLGHAENRKFNNPR